MTAAFTLAAVTMRLFMSYMLWACNLSTRPEVTNTGRQSCFWGRCRARSHYHSIFVTPIRGQ